MNAKSFLFIFVLSVLISSVFAGGGTFVVKAVTQPKIDYYFWNNASLEENLQKYTVSWENTGSISCRLRVGVYVFDLQNVSQKISVIGNIEHVAYVAWSNNIESPSGSISTIELFSPLSQGNYTAQINVFYCNNLIEFGPYNLTVNKTKNFDNQTIKVNNVEVFDDHLEIRMQSKKPYDKLYTYPKSYPFGWIVEQNSLNNIKENEERTINIKYEHSVKKEEYVTLRFATDDALTDVDVLIKQKEFDIRLIILPILMLIVTIGLFCLYKLRYKKNKSNSIRPKSFVGKRKAQL